MGSTRHITTGTLTTRSTPRRSTRRLGVATLAAIALAASACGGDDDESSAAVPAREEAVADGDDAVRSAPNTGGTAADALPLEDFGRDIIRSVGLTMTTSDVRETADDIRRVVARNGGAVFASDVTIEQPRDDGSVPGGGQIVVKIPPADLDRLVADLDGVGTVSRLTQDADDVTEQLLDVEIRIRQAEASIERIEALLVDATDLDAVFAIETDLAQRQVALEQLRAAQRNTENLVELATLTVNVDFVAPGDVADDGDPGIADGFRAGWDAFVGSLFAIVLVLATVSPFLVVVAVLAMTARWVFSRLRRRSAEQREQRRLAADLAGPRTMPAPAEAPAEQAAPVPVGADAASQPAPPAPESRIASPGDASAGE